MMIKEFFENKVIEAVKKASLDGKLGGYPILNFLLCAKRQKTLNLAIMQ